MEVHEALASAEAAGMKITVVDDLRLRITGPKSKSELTKFLMKHKFEVIDEFTLRKLNCFHLPGTPLGDLARALMKWFNNEMVQADDSTHRVNVKGMAFQMITKAASLPGPGPDAELSAMVVGFKSITQLHAWAWRSRDNDFPEITAPLSTNAPRPNDSGLKPGKVIPPKGEGGKKNLYGK